MGAMNVVIAGGAKLLSLPFYALLYEHRLTDVVAATGGWAWVILDRCDVRGWSRTNVWCLMSHGSE